MRQFTKVFKVEWTYKAFNRGDVVRLLFGARGEQRVTPDPEYVVAQFIHPTKPGEYGRVVLEGRIELEDAQNCVLVRDYREAA